MTLYADSFVSHRSFASSEDRIVELLTGAWPLAQGESASPHPHSVEPANSVQTRLDAEPPPACAPLMHHRHTASLATFATTIQSPLTMVTSAARTRGSGEQEASAAWRSRCTRGEALNAVVARAPAHAPGDIVDSMVTVLARESYQRITIEWCPFCVTGLPWWYNNNNTSALFSLMFLGGLYYPRVAERQLIERHGSWFLGGYYPRT